MKIINKFVKISMGHKVNPISYRLGGIFTWNSKWFASKEKFIIFLKQDITIKKYLKKLLKEAAIAKIEIERSSNKLRINIISAKPGVIIGRGGTGIEDLKKKIKNEFFANAKVDLDVNVFEEQNPSTNATLIIQMIADAIEKRVPYRKCVKQSIAKVEKAGALGIKIRVSGRLNGVEIARTETFSSGKIPLHTLRANIDYSRGVANTTYGTIGIKVWIYKGEIFANKEQEAKQMINK